MEGPSEYVELSESSISNNCGSEWGLFDRQGVLVSSYRRRGNAHDVYEYSHAASNMIESHLVVRDEATARACCEYWLEERNRRLASPAPSPSADAMRKLLGG